MAWSSGDVLANGIRLHYYRTGGDKPPLVLAHGVTDYGLCWTRVADHLAHDYDVLMVDARGHGYSEAARSGYTWAALARDLASFLLVLGLERPALMGHSMGAETVAQVAAHYPELVGRAVLEDPPWQDGDRAGRDPEQVLAQARASIVEGNSMSREALEAQCRADAPHWAEEEIGPWAEAKRLVRPEVAAILAAPLPPWRETAAAIAAPTLLITGEPGKALVTPACAAEATRAMRHGQELHIARAGHSIHRDAFEQTMAGVSRFLAGA